MLTEFALTPSVFDEIAHPSCAEWQDELRELGSGIFPRGAASPAIVANLHGSAWYEVVANVVARIRDQRARHLCQGLYTKLADILVPRPCTTSTPSTELEWAQAALACPAKYPIDRIVVTKATKDAERLDSPPVYALNEVQTDNFWEAVSSSADPVMEIAPQVAQLRKVCLHAEFLWLVTPDIHGADDDETPFAIALIRSAFDRPAGFSVPEVEIHTQGPNLDPQSPEYTRRLTTAASNIRQSIKTALRSGQSVGLVIWKRLLDRLLIAGSYTRDVGGQRIRRPRWGVAMNHIARPGDLRRAIPPTHWNLLPGTALAQRFAWFGEANRPDRVRTEIVRG